MNILVIPAWHDCSNPLYAGFFHEFCQSISKFGGVVMLDVKVHNFLEKKHYVPKKDAYKRNYKYLPFHYFNSIPGSFFGLNIKYQKKKIIKKSLQLIQDYQMDNGKFDVVHILSVCNTITPIIATEIATANNIPYVITEHYSGFDDNVNHIFLPYSNRNEISSVVQNASLRLGVSNYACNRYEEYFKTPFIVFPNSVDKVFENKLPDPINPRDDTFTFMCIGRIERNKGQLMLIQSFKNLNNKYPNLKLKLIGDGVDKQIIQEIINKENLTSISIDNWKNKEELIEEIDKSQVIISASIKETFGLTIVEGFFRGKPTISTDSGGPRDFITSQNGILVEKYDEKSIELALETMYLNYSNFKSDEIRMNAIAKFSEESVGNSMLRLYQNLKL